VVRQPGLATGLSISHYILTPNYGILHKLKNVRPETQPLHLPEKWNNRELTKF